MKRKANDGQGLKRTGIAYLPTDEDEKLVHDLVIAGCTKEQICQVLDITEPILYKHFREILDKGRIKAYGKIGKTVYQRAIDGDNTCLIWYSKTQMGWKETNVQEVNYPQLQHVEASRRETREEYEQRKALELKEQNTIDISSTDNKKELLTQNNKD